MNIERGQVWIAGGGAEVTVTQCGPKTVTFSNGKNAQRLSVQGFLSLLTPKTVEVAPEAPAAQVEEVTPEAPAAQVEEQAEAEKSISSNSEKQGRDFIAEVAAQLGVSVKEALWSHPATIQAYCEAQEDDRRLKPS